MAITNSRYLLVNQFAGSPSSVTVHAIDDDAFTLHEIDLSTISHIHTHGGLLNLGNDDHQQYVLASGQRDMTGALKISMGTPHVLLIPSADSNISTFATRGSILRLSVDSNNDGNNQKFEIWLNRDKDMGGSNDGTRKLAWDLVQNIFEVSSDIDLDGFKVLDSIAYFLREGGDRFVGINGSNKMTFRQDGGIDYISTSAQRHLFNNPLQISGRITQSNGAILNTDGTFFDIGANHGTMRLMLDQDNDSSGESFQIYKDRPVGGIGGTLLLSLNSSGTLTISGLEMSGGPINDVTDITLKNGATRAVAMNGANRPEILFLDNGKLTLISRNLADIDLFPGSAAVNLNNSLIVGLVQATQTTHAVAAGRNISTGSGISGGGNLTADRTLTWNGLTMKNNGTAVGTRRNLNLVPGTNVTISATDSSASDQVTYTINAEVSEGGGWTDTGTVVRLTTETDGVKIGGGPGPAAGVKLRVNGDTHIDARLSCGDIGGTPPNKTPLLAWESGSGNAMVQLQVTAADNFDSALFAGNFLIGFVYDALLAQLQFKFKDENGTVKTGTLTVA